MSRGLPVIPFPSPRPVVPMPAGDSSVTMLNQLRELLHVGGRAAAEVIQTDTLRQRQDQQLKHAEFQTELLQKRVAAEELELQTEGMISEIRKTEAQIGLATERQRELALMDESLLALLPNEKLRSEFLKQYPLADPQTHARAMRLVGSRRWTEEGEPEYLQEIQHKLAEAAASGSTDDVLGQAFSNDAFIDFVRPRTTDMEYHEAAGFTLAAAETFVNAKRQHLLDLNQQSVQRIHQQSAQDAIGAIGRHVFAMDEHPASEWVDQLNALINEKIAQSMALGSPTFKTRREFAAAVYGALDNPFGTDPVALSQLAPKLQNDPTLGHYFGKAGDFNLDRLIGVTPDGGIQGAGSLWQAWFGNQERTIQRRRADAYRRANEQGTISGEAMVATWVDHIASTRAWINGLGAPPSITEDLLLLTVDDEKILDTDIGKRAKTLSNLQGNLSGDPASMLTAIEGTGRPITDAEMFRGGNQSPITLAYFGNMQRFMSQHSPQSGSHPIRGAFAKTLRDGRMIPQTAIYFSPLGQVITDRLKTLITAYPSIENMPLDRTQWPQYEALHTIDMLVQHLGESAATSYLKRNLGEQEYMLAWLGWQRLQMSDGFDRATGRIDTNHPDIVSTFSMLGDPDTPERMALATEAAFNTGKAVLETVPGLEDLDAQNADHRRMAVELAFQSMLGQVYENAQLAVLPGDMFDRVMAAYLVGWLEQRRAGRVPDPGGQFAEAVRNRATQVLERTLQGVAFEGTLQFADRDMYAFDAGGMEYTVRRQLPVPHGVEPGIIPTPLDTVELETTHDFLDLWIQRTRGTRTNVGYGNVIHDWNNGVILTQDMIAQYLRDTHLQIIAREDAARTLQPGPEKSEAMAQARSLRKQRAESVPWLRENMNDVVLVPTFEQSGGVLHEPQWFIWPRTEEGRKAMTERFQSNPNEMPIVAVWNAGVLTERLNRALAETLASNDLLPRSIGD